MPWGMWVCCCLVSSPALRLQQAQYCDKVCGERRMCVQAPGAAGTALGLLWCACWLCMGTSTAAPKARPALMALLRWTQLGVLSVCYHGAGGCVRALRVRARVVMSDASMRESI
jgi:hypothetical protein